jgi:hypothetical protein
MSAGARRPLRGLILGLVAGPLLALLFALSLSASGPILVPTCDRAPEITTMLKNPLQIARYGVRALGGAAGYKSARLAASPLLRQSPSSLSKLPHSHTKLFSTSPAAMASKKSFLEAIKERRTIYAVDKNSPISDADITALVKDIVLHTPSSFNSQSARIVLLLNDEHDKFWDFVLEVLKPIVPEDQFPSTEKRVAGFRGGKGTVSAPPRLRRAREAVRRGR